MGGTIHLAIRMKRVMDNIVVADDSSELIVNLGQWNFHDCTCTFASSFLKLINVLILDRGALVPTWAKIILVILTKCISSPSSIHTLGVDTGFSMIPSMTTSAS